VARPTEGHAVHAVNVHILGTVMFILWAAQWAVMALGPGGFPHEKPSEGVIAKTYNFLNMLTVGIVMPLVAILFMIGYLGPIEVLRIHIPEGRTLVAVEIAGMGFYLAAHLLISWARFSIGDSFQMGGVAPRPSDNLIARGAYSVVRHPMYTALLCFDLGLALMTQSLVLLSLFAALLVVVLLLVPVEERQLETAYGEQYVEYRKKVKGLVPLVY